MFVVSKKSIDFILFGNVFVALGAFFLVYSSVIQLQLAHHLHYAVLVFFATLFVYNLQRIFYKKQNAIPFQSVRRNWIAENQGAVKLLAFIGFLGVSVLFFYNDTKIIFYLSPLLLLSLFYFLPFIKLRKKAWLKLIVLSLVWTIVTSVVPILLNGEGVIEKNQVLHIATRFCFMIAICIPFDIRDLQVDKSESISTLPILYGEKKTRAIAIVFMLLYIFLIFLEFFSGMFEIKIFVALLISAIINTVLVFMTNSKRNEYFYTAALDGTMVVQGGLLILANLWK